MQYWLRKAYLTLGNSRYSIEDFSFDFKVTYEDRAKLPIAEIHVFNLSPSTRNSLKKGEDVILSAGYKDDVGCLFVGTLSSYVNKRDGLDVVTTIQAADNMEAWVGRNVNKTYKQGMYASQILSDLLNVFGIEVSVLRLKTDKYYPGCKVCRGKLKDILRSIVCSDCKSRLLLRSGKLIINPPEDGINTGYSLTPQTGLLKSSSTMERQTTSSSAKATNKTRSQQADSEGTIKRECLLNYHIGIADKVYIHDSDTDGLFLIQTLTHQGSSSGDWKTILEANPA